MTYFSSSGCGAKTHFKSKTTKPIITRSPTTPPGVFNVSVKSKMNPMSVLPINFILEIAAQRAANGVDNDTLGNFNVKVLLIS